MSTEIKPGDTIVTVQDAPTLLGRALPKGTHGTVIRSGPPIVGPYSVYARFEGDRPGDGRQVRPGDVAVVSAPSLPTQDGDDDGREAASLDPAPVKAGDWAAVEVEPYSGPKYTLAGTVQQVGVSLWIGPIPITMAADDTAKITLTDHQPAPEPKQEWKPGMTGTAHVVSDDATTKDGRVFRKMRGMVVHRPAPIDDDMFVTTEGELWGLEGEYCKNFVPDEPRPLPTRGELHAAITHNDCLKTDPGTGMTYIDPDLAAEHLAVVLRGESR